MSDLTPRTRNRLFLITAVAVVLLLTLVIWGSAFSDRSGTQALLWLAFAAIGLSVGAAAAIWVGSGKTRLEAKLAPEYFLGYEDLREWLHLSTLSARERSEVLEDVLGLLRHAQASNRPCSDVIGSDPAQFVRRVQESHGYRSSVVFWFLNAVGTVAWLLPVVQLVVWLTRTLENSTLGSYFDAAIGISLIPFMLTLAFVVIPMTHRALARGHATAAIALPLGFGLSFVLISKALRHFVADVPWVRAFLDGEVAILGSWIAVIIWAAIASAAMIALAYLRQASLSWLKSTRS